MELPLELLFVLGVLSSVIVWILKFVFVNKGKAVPAWVYTIGLYIVAFVLSLAFNPLKLPPFPPYVDLASFAVAILAWFAAVIPVVSAEVGFATLVYQALLKRVLDGLGNAFRAYLKKNK